MKKLKTLLLLVIMTTMLCGTIEVQAAPIKDIGYKKLFDAVYYTEKYPDLKNAFGYNEKLLYKHFLTYGMKEGRNASPEFNILGYKNSYTDLQNAFGENLKQYYEHYIIYGIKEGRINGVDVNYNESYTADYSSGGSDNYVAEDTYSDGDNTESQDTSNNNENSTGAYYHNLVTDANIGHHFHWPKYQYYIDKVLANDNYFITDIGDNHGMGLNDVYYNYLQMDNQMFTREYNEDYTSYSIDEEHFNLMREKLLVVDAGYKRYSDFIFSALNSMNLNTTDKDLVNQINNFICNHFSYELTNNKFFYSFTDSGVGQCMHYANLFRDMCRVAGIESYYIGGTTADGADHAWSSVIIDGNTYYFDVTWNDGSSNNSKYSWMTEAELTHIQEYVE